MAKIKTTHNIFVDGSHKLLESGENITGIGVYDSLTGFKLSLVENSKDALAAEHSALRHAIRYAQYNGIVEKSRIYTDCEQVYKFQRNIIKSHGFIDLIWIPRELNTIADSLAGAYKNETISTSTSVKFSKNSIITKTKTFTTIKHKKASLTAGEMINLFASYPVKTRISLLKKLTRYNPDAIKQNTENLKQLMNLPYDKSAIKMNNFKRFAIAILKKDYLSSGLKYTFKNTDKPGADAINQLLRDLK